MEILNGLEYSVYGVIFDKRVTLVIRQFKNLKKMEVMP